MSLYHTVQLYHTVSLHSTVPLYHTIPMYHTAPLCPTIPMYQALPLYPTVSIYHCIILCHCSILYHFITLCHYFYFLNLLVYLLADPGKARGCSIEVYTNKQMLIGVYLDARQSSSTSKSAEGLQKVGIMKRLLWSTVAVLTEDSYPGNFHL